MRRCGGRCAVRLGGDGAEGVSFDSSTSISTTTSTSTPAGGASAVSASSFSFRTASSTSIGTSFSSSPFSGSTGDKEELGATLPSMTASTDRP